jgi:hypothetical protein
MLITVGDARGRDREHLVDLMERAAGEPAAAAEFREHVLAGPAVRATLDLIDRYNAAARDALAVVPPGRTRDGLLEVPQRYLDDILAEKVPAPLR